MSKIVERRALRLAAAGLLLLASLFGALLLLPRILKLEAVKTRVFSELSRKFPGRIDAQQIDLSFEPLPAVSLRGVRLDAPRVSAAADSLSVALDPRSLLRGEVRIASVRLDAPRVTVRIPETPSTTGGPPKVSLALVEQEASRFLTKIEPLLSEVEMSLRDATVYLNDGKTTRFKLEALDIQVALAGSSLTLEAACTASIARRAGVRLSFDTRRWEGQGRVSLSKLRPDDFLRYLGPGKPLPVAGSEWSGEVRVEARGRGNATAAVDLSAPSLRIARGKAVLPLEGLHMVGSAAFEGPRRRFDLRQLSLSSPKVTASAVLSWDLSVRQAALDASASDLDLAPLRAAALAVAPEVPLVRTVCGVVRAGRVSRLSAWARAPSPDGLAGALTLRADFREGVVQVPGAELTASQASGRLSVSGQGASGEGLACRVGATTARNGSLRMGFRGSRSPFHLEADVDADLTQVRDLLPRWLPKGAARDQLARVTALTGKASGRVVLGERLDALSPALEIRSFELAGRYRPIPFPLQLRGSFGLRGDRVSADGLAGSIGATSVRNGSLRMGFGGGSRPFHLETEFTADLAQVHEMLPGWLPNGALRDEFQRVTAASGRASGRLVLGERLDALSPALDVRSFELAARYRRLPFPLQLRGSLAFGGGRAALRGLSGRVGRASLSGVSAEATFGRAPALRVTSARAALALEDFYPWLLGLPGFRSALRDFGPPTGRLTVDSARLSGPLQTPSRWRFQAGATVERLAVPSVLYPGRLRVASGTLTVTERDLSWSGLRASLLDASVVTSGRLSGLRSASRSADLALDGVVGPRTIGWAEREASLTTPLLIRQPIVVNRGHVVWSGKAAGFTGELKFGKGPAASVDLEKAGDRIVARRIAVTDPASDALMSLAVRKGVWDVSFSGRLAGSTVDALIDRRTFVCRNIEGKFQAHVLAATPRQSSATGHLALAGLKVALKGLPPLAVESATLSGLGKTLRVDSARVAVGPARFSVEGRVDAQKDSHRTDLTIFADGVDLKALEQTFAAGSRGAGTRRAGRGDSAGPGDAEEERALREARQLPVSGSVSVDVGTLQYGRYAWTPVRSTFTVAGGTLTGDVREARLCGIDLPGRVVIGPPGISAAWKADTQGESLDDFLSCLWDRKGLATGRFRLGVDVSVRGTPSRLLRSSRGNISFRAGNGRIQRFGLLAKVFALLNATEIFRGRLSDLFHEGMGYDTIDVEGTLRDGILTFEKGFLNAQSVRIFWHGRVDLVKQEVDLTILVSPFRTLDTIISHIPLVNYIMADRLIAVPVQVEGNLEDPIVIPLDPADIGAELLGVLERTVELPWKLIQPLIPRSRPRERLQ